MLKVLGFLVFVQIVTSGSDNEETFVLENKATGKILGGEKRSFVTEEDWEGGDWQLWNVEPRGDAGYSVLRNVQSGKVLKYPSNSSEYQLWNADANSEKWVQLNRYILVVNRTGLYFALRENDKRDRWYLVEGSKMIRDEFKIEPRGGL